ncbi:MAG: hypothetical protein E7218_06380, partial [Anaerofustis stercorihominis]|nr:hypothetical protein [Anaerofustis stercorihominis]
MKYGLLGEKLSHSFSPQIHMALADYTYELMEVAPENIDKFMTERDFSAINVTIPYKQTVIPYLDSIDEAAKEIGAVNTVVNRDGKLYGYNTDYYGLISLMERTGISLKDKKVLILGSGGTSKTARVAAKELGAREIYRLSRTAREDCITYEDALNSHTDSEIIINTTPAGMYPEIYSKAISLEKFHKLEGVVDAIYNPLCPLLVLEAKEKGIKATGGLYMLVAQAAKASEYFIGKKPDEDAVERVYNDLLKNKENIVLIGMPSSGKTSVGSVLSEKLGKSLVDTDSLIVEKAGMEITEIFARYGEKHFRDLETEVIKELSSKQDLIISTGGGAILREENVRALKHNGVVVFLDRPLDKLIATDDRPLSSNVSDLKKRYNERIDIYNSSADIKINVVEGIEKTAEIVINECPYG